MRPARTIMNELLVLTNNMYRDRPFSRHARPTTSLKHELRHLTATRCTRQPDDENQRNVLNATKLRQAIRACRDLHSGFHLRRRASRAKLLRLLTDLEKHLHANDGNGSHDLATYVVEQQAKRARAKRRKQVYSHLIRGLDFNRTHQLFKTFKSDDAAEADLALLDQLYLQQNQGLYREFHDRRLQDALSFQPELLRGLLDRTITVDEIRASYITSTFERIEGRGINQANIAILAFKKLAKGLPDLEKSHLMSKFTYRTTFTTEAVEAFERLLSYPKALSDLDDRGVQRNIKSPAALHQYIDAYEEELVAAFDRYADELAGVEVALECASPVPPADSPRDYRQPASPSTVAQTLPYRMMTGGAPKEPSIARCSEQREVLVSGSRFTFS
ncbi:MAG: hypothetical protein P1U40_13275 [Coxiellaceae bacterium]|nr:hypothetical protein [Coxiellaceae bacterium]